MGLLQIQRPARSEIRSESSGRPPELVYWRVKVTDAEALREPFVS